MALHSSVVALLALTPLSVLCARLDGSYSWSSETTPYSEVDVAIIGGGSSGMYTATRLQQLNKTVVVLEPRDRSGGHVSTYVDPDFAAYLNVALEPVSLLSSAADKQVLVDFSTAQTVPQAVVDSLGEAGPAYARYLQLLAEYDYLKSGFHLPYPVPEDLHGSWAQMISKYNLSGLAFNVDLFNQGWVDILNQPAIYVLKGFGQLLLQSFVAGYELTTASHNNQELFDAAAAKLGPSSVMLNTSVKRIRRGKEGVHVTVDTPSGQHRISAKKLLITIPPLLSNLEPIMHLNSEERDLFSQFSCGSYWCGVVRDSGLPDDFSLYGVGPSNPYYIADQPGLLTVIPSGVSGLHRVYFGSPHSLPDEEVSSKIRVAFERAIESLGYDSSNVAIPYIRSHAPYHCTVSANQIKTGFYDRLQGLQGFRNTFYTGAAFQSHDSGSIWMFTENEILPQLLA